MQINGLIKFQIRWFYPAGINLINRGIKHISSNLKVPALNIEIKDTSSKSSDLRLYRKDTGPIFRLKPNPTLFTFIKFGTFTTYCYLKGILQ